MAGLMGEFRVSAAGRDWTLRLDFNALCAFEEAGGGDAVAALSAMADSGSPSPVMIRRLVWAMLQRHHPGATLMDAGDVLSLAQDDVMAGIAAAMPQEADDPGAGRAAGNGAGRPGA